MKPVLVFRHRPHEGLGTIESFFQLNRIPFYYCDLFHSDELPKKVKNFSFVIALGGPMNADDTAQYPSLDWERTFIRRAIDLKVPVLGICLGSQIIARALGARVFSEAKKEIGWYSIQLTGEATRHPVFRFLKESQLQVFQWHGDTFDLPSGATRLASSKFFKNQAFFFNQNVYAFQFHVEVTQEMIEAWIVENQSELNDVSSSISTDEILRKTKLYLPALHEMSQAVYRGLFSSLSPNGSRQESLQGSSK